MKEKAIWNKQANKQTNKPRRNVQIKKQTKKNKHKQTNTYQSHKEAITRADPSISVKSK